MRPLRLLHGLLGLLLALVCNVPDPADPDQRAGALILEVKRDFCYRVQEILRKYGCESDTVEISLDCEYRYNLFHNDLEAYALASGIASLLNNSFGTGKEPFWQQTSPEERICHLAKRCDAHH